LLPKFLKFKDPKERGVVTNWPTLLRWIADEGFPAGIKLGPNVRAWREDEIEAWLESRPQAKVA
jgi:predicted DNA-binding transcriptional regulator AlpA